MKTSHRSLCSLWSAALLGTSALSVLVGCTAVSNTASDSTAKQALSIRGSLHGGQQPVSGSQVYLYSVGTTSGGASTSMLTGAGYVTTDAAGNFNITGDYTCPSGNADISTYVLALGGNPGINGVTSNTAIAMMAALGPCSGLSSSTVIQINELSTVAAVTALQQFMTDATHIGAATLSTQPGYSAVASIPNAMTTVNNLVSLSTGAALAAPVNGNGTSPQAKTNTLGNILAACINSASPSSPSCNALFTATTPSGGAAPTDTIGAMLQIARNPGTNVSTLFTQASPVAPFQPALTTLPNDLSLAISFTGGTLSSPGASVIDYAGNVWIANCPSCTGNTAGVDSIVGFTPSGAITSNAPAYVTNIHKPVAIAIDRYNGIWVAEAANASQGNQLTLINNTTGAIEYPVGNNNAAPNVGFPLNLPGIPGGIALTEDNPADAWVTDTSNGQLNHVKYDGTLLGTLPTIGISSPTAIVADGLQNLYFVGNGANSIVQYSAAGQFTSYTGAGISGPVGLAADGGDHIWTLDQSGNRAVSEVFGYTGAPTSGSNGYNVGINTASGIAIDGAGTAWIANCRNNRGGSAPDNIIHLSSTGTSLLASDGLQSTTLQNPTAVSIDISGNLWISSTGAGNMTEVVGVAAPVVAELETASSRHALGAINYLQNGSFEAGGQVRGDAGPNAIPGWTYSSSLSISGADGVDSGSPFAGAQKLTFYTGNPYQVSETQTVNVPNGTYLLSCYVAGDPNHPTRTASLTATTNGSSSSNALANLNYSFQPYSVPNVVVTNGTLTVSLNNNDTVGGYVGWDSCSVTQQ